MSSGRTPLPATSRNRPPNEREQADQHNGQQPRLVFFSVFAVLLQRPHQHRNVDGGEHAAQQHVVEQVGEHVRHVVGLAERAGAERDHDDRGAHETGDPRDDRAKRHHGTGLQQRARPAAALTARWRVVGMGEQLLRRRLIPWHGRRWSRCAKPPWPGHAWVCGSVGRTRPERRGDVRVCRVGIGSARLGVSHRILRFVASAPRHAMIDAALRLWRARPR
jgi:hypothetical protein